MGELRTAIKEALDAERSRLIGIAQTLRTGSPKREAVKAQIEVIEDFNTILVEPGECYMEITRPFDPNARIRL